MVYTGWIDGYIKPLPSTDLKMPHMGWNIVKPVNKNQLIQDSSDFILYILIILKQPNKGILAESQYGINFASIIGKENIYGVQFHPEKVPPRD